MNGTAASGIAICASAALRGRIVQRRRGSHGMDVEDRTGWNRS
jgi:hypothetical protein